MLLGPSFWQAALIAAGKRTYSGRNSDAMIYYRGYSAFEEVSLLSALATTPWQHHTPYNLLERGVAIIITHIAGKEVSVMNWHLVVSKLLVVVIHNPPLLTST